MARSHTPWPLLAIAALALGCGESTTRSRAQAGTRSGPPGPNVLEWGGGSRWGWSRLTVDRAGAVVSEGGEQGGPTQRATLALDAAGLAALEHDLRAAGCCDLESKRDTGVPDEGKTELRLDFERLSCAVELWDNEWREDRAKACHAALGALGRRTVKAAPDAAAPDAGP